MTTSAPYSTSPYKNATSAPAPVSSVSAGAKPPSSFTSSHPSSTSLSSSHTAAPSSYSAHGSAHGSYGLSGSHAPSAAPAPPPIYKDEVVADPLEALLAIGETLDMEARKNKQKLEEMKKKNLPLEQVVNHENPEGIYDVKGRIGEGYAVQYNLTVQVQRPQFIQLFIRPLVKKLLLKK